jgi:hypothetical protein
MQARKRRREGVLHHIVRLIGTTQEARCKAHHGFHVMTKNGLASPPVTRQRATDKLFVRDALKRARRRNRLQKRLFGGFRDATHEHFSMAQQPAKTAHTICANAEMPTP